MMHAHPRPLRQGFNAIQQPQRNIQTKALAQQARLSQPAATRRILRLDTGEVDRSPLTG